MATVIMASVSCDSEVLENATKKSLARSICVIILDYALIFATASAAIAVDHNFAYVIAVALIGSRQYALGEAMAHEASHYNLCRSRRMNDLLGRVAIWPMAMTLRGYRRYHVAHHRVPLSDPLNNVYDEYAEWGLPDHREPLTSTEAIWHLLVKPLAGYISLLHLWFLISTFWTEAELKETWWLLLFLVVSAALAVVTGYSSVLLWYWIVPYLAVFPVLNFWSEVGDHYRVAGANTRTDTNWFLNTLLSQNIGYHALHHRRPDIPWFRLRDIYCAMGSDVKDQLSSGYPETFQQIKNYTGGADFDQSRGA
jgi:fatty acid desaturase